MDAAADDDVSLAEVTVGSPSAVDSQPEEVVLLIPKDERQEDDDVIMTESAEPQPEEEELVHMRTDHIYSQAAHDLRQKKATVTSTSESQDVTLTSATNNNK